MYSGSKMGKSNFCSEAFAIVALKISCLCQCFLYLLLPSDSSATVGGVETAAFSVRLQFTRASFFFTYYSSFILPEKEKKEIIRYEWSTAVWYYNARVVHVSLILFRVSAVVDFFRFLPMGVFTYVNQIRINWAMMPCIAWVNRRAAPSSSPPFDILPIWLFDLIYHLSIRLDPIWFHFVRTLRKKRSISSRQCIMDTRLRPVRVPFFFFASYWILFSPVGC